MASDAAPRAVLPRTVDEWLRVAHALRWGAHVKDGPVYVVMSDTAPLYQVQGVTTSLADARALLRQDILPDAGWEPPEVTSRRIFGPIELPETWFTNSFAPIGKPFYTGTQIGAELPLAPGGTSQLPAPYEVTRCQLRVDWEHDGTTYSRTWNFSPDTMAIFLTRGSAEMFLYPHYQAFFGYDYEGELRTRNGQT
jgi:hypothetical protein